ncbi:MAG: hypothetical protein MRY59_02055 [Aquisalinus sp.]|nr:hypothetical protein [Aquisalinus sp.]
MRTIILLSTLLLATSACGSVVEQKYTDNSDYARAEITMGNGGKNWIIIEGMTRENATFTFPEVRIAGNGWLVMHPFTDGKPNGNIYVGHTYIKDGVNTDVEISVEPAPSSGNMFIVMLHRDVDEDREFDFVFVDETHVEDRAVFEGSTMIAHAIAAP